MKTLELQSIRLDGGTQCRAKLDDEYIAALSAAWLDGAKIPAVTVYHDGSNYWLADGFHRYHAAQKCEFRDLLCDVVSGTRLDAIKHALGANAAHGLRRTNEDKRRAVEIALKEFPKLSNVEVAKICAVSDKTVAACRPSLVARSEIPNVSTRTDSLGRQQPAHKLTRPAPVTIQRAEVVRFEPVSKPESPAPKPEAPAIGGPLAEIAADAERGACPPPAATSTPVVEIAAAKAPEPCPAAKKAGDEAEHDSETLWRLKSLWNKTNKRDRADFLAWIRKE